MSVTYLGRTGKECRWGRKSEARHVLARLYFAQVLLNVKRTSSNYVLSHYYLYTLTSHAQGTPKRDGTLHGQCLLNA